MNAVNSFQYASYDLVIKPKILEAVCEVIDKTYGRMSPAGVYREPFFRNHQVRINHAVNSGKHFDESLGKTFVSLIDRDAIETTIKGITTYF